MEPKRRGNPNWVKGVSGNPGGRAKSGFGLTTSIRERVDPDELVDLAVSTMRGMPLYRMTQSSTGECATWRRLEPGWTLVEVLWPTMEHILSARTFLAERGYFKPASTLDLNVSSEPGETSEIDYSKLSPAELDQLLTLHDKATGVIDAEADTATSHLLPSGTDYSGLTTPKGEDE